MEVDKKEADKQAALVELAPIKIEAPSPAKSEG